MSTSTTTFVRTEMAGAPGIAGRVHEYSSADAITRHLARDLDAELRDVDAYGHVMTRYSGSVAVFARPVTAEVIETIHAAGCEVVGTSTVDSGSVVLHVERASRGV